MAAPTLSFTATLKFVQLDIWIMMISWKNNTECVYLVRGRIESVGYRIIWGLEIVVYLQSVQCTGYIKSSKIWLKNDQRPFYAVWFFRLLKFRVSVPHTSLVHSPPSFRLLLRSSNTAQFPCQEQDEFLQFWVKFCDLKTRKKLMKYIASMLSSYYFFDLFLMIYAILTVFRESKIECWGIIVYLKRWARPSLNKCTPRTATTSLSSTYYIPIRSRICRWFKVLLLVMR